MIKNYFLMLMLLWTQTALLKIAAPADNPSTQDPATISDQQLKALLMAQDPELPVYSQTLEILYKNPNLVMTTWQISSPVPIEPSEQPTAPLSVTQSIMQYVQANTTEKQPSGNTEILLYFMLKSAAVNDYVSEKERLDTLRDLSTLEQKDYAELDEAWAWGQAHDQQLTNTTSDEYKEYAIMMPFLINIIKSQRALLTVEDALPEVVLAYLSLRAAIESQADGAEEFLGRQIKVPDAESEKVMAAWAWGLARDTTVNDDYQELDPTAALAAFMRANDKSEGTALIEVTRVDPNAIPLESTRADFDPND